MVKILVSSSKDIISKTAWENHWRSLPNNFKSNALRYKREEDRDSYIRGKLLLQKGLISYGYSSSCLKDIKTDSWGKPYINPQINFSISHSENYIVCAFSEIEPIGIDIERIRNLDLSIFRKIFTKKEWEILNSSSNPIEHFFRYWTIKESIVKGEGKGFSIPLSTIDASNLNSIKFNSSIWIIQEISLSPLFSCSLASKSKSDYQMIPIDLNIE